MSNYTKITRHPQMKHYEVAEYLDDYFGHHLYGVKFADGKVYPIDQVERTQLQEFWAEDVIAAFRSYIHTYSGVVAEQDVLNFLGRLDQAYHNRWKRDPHGGEGAVDNFRKKVQIEIKEA